MATESPRLQTDKKIQTSMLLQAELGTWVDPM